MAILETDPQVAAFEMLVCRLSRLEDAVGRTERLLRDQGPAADVRDLLLVSTASLVGRKLSSHDRTYKLCQRLEETLHDAAAPHHAPGAEVVERAVARLRQLGAGQLTFLVLCQISNMTDGLEDVLRLARDSAAVAPVDCLAFALHAEDLVRMHHQGGGPRAEALSRETREMVDALESHWEALRYRPGAPWTIGYY